MYSALLPQVLLLSLMTLLHAAVRSCPNAHAQVAAHLMAQRLMRWHRLRAQQAALALLSYSQWLQVPWMAVKRLNDRSAAVWAVPSGWASAPESVSSAA
jgi:hypothetical protein